MPIIRVVGSVILLGSLTGAVGNSVTATQTLSANLGAQAKVSVVQSGVNLLRTGATFTGFAGAVTVQYKVRTTPSGSCTLSLQGAGDFSPAGGPSTTNADLAYSCGGATLGSACSGSQTVQTTSPTSVVTVGGGACTGPGCAGANPNSVSVSLTLADSPTFKTGGYSSDLTFSIKAN